jgi:hypothetical protein
MILNEINLGLVFALGTDLTYFFNFSFLRIFSNSITDAKQNQKASSLS